MARTVTIRSTLGGLCRVRSASALTATGAAVRPASGPNANPFYRVHQVASPILASGAQLQTVAPPSGTTMEFMTEAGGHYQLHA